MHRSAAGRVSYATCIPRVRVWLLAAVASACGLGCTSDDCTERAAEAQIDIRLADEAALAAARQARVSLQVNDGTLLTRRFDVSQPSFVFEFDKLDVSPRTLTIVARALDGESRPIGEGTLQTGFRPDGCNFFAVTISPLAPEGDAGVDGATDRDQDLDATPDAGNPG